MICPACAKAADEKEGRENHCLLGPADCTCQHRVPEGQLELFTKDDVALG